MMNKGIVFTSAAFIIVMIIFSLASTMTSNNEESARDTNLIISADKIEYGLDSVKSQLFEASGLNVSKIGTNLTIFDHIPKNENPSSYYEQYENFTRDKFTNPSITVNFTDLNGNPVVWEDIDKIVVKPFNITYEYTEDTGGERIRIEYLDISQLHHLVRMEVLAITEDSLQNPSENWSPEQECNPPGVTPDCLPFSAIVTDNTDTWESGEKNFELDQQSAVQHNIDVPGSAFLRITVGDTGGGNDLIEIRTQNTESDISIRMVFDTTNFNIGLQDVKLGVYDTFSYKEEAF